MFVLTVWFGRSEGPVCFVGRLELVNWALSLYKLVGKLGYFVSFCNNTRRVDIMASAGVELPTQVYEANELTIRLISCATHIAVGYVFLFKHYQHD